jgi:hypothetical protein
MATTTRPNRLKWVVSALGILLLVCVAGVVIVFISSCSVNKYIVAAGLPAPDSGFQTGSIYGYDVFIWDCYQGKHIVLYHTSSEMTSGPYSRQETACGELAPIEIQLANERKRILDPSRFW